MTRFFITHFRYFLLLSSVFCCGNIYTQNKSDNTLEFEKLMPFIHNLVARNPDSAVVIIKETLKKIDSFENSKQSIILKIQLNNKLGVCYTSLGQFNQGIEYYLEAYKLAVSNNLTGSLHKTYSGLGSAFSKISYKQKSEDYYTKAKIWCIINKDSTSLSIVLYNMALTCADNRKNNEAERLLNEAEKITLAKNNYVMLSNINRTRALYYRKINQFKKSYHYALKSINYASKSGDDYTLYYDYLVLCKIELELDLIDSAQVHKAMALSWAKNKNDIAINITAQECDYLIYKKKKQWEKAFLSFEKTNEFRDILYNDENKNRIIQKNAEFEFELQRLKLAAENQVLEKNHQLKLQRYIFVVAFILIALLFILVNNLRFRKLLAISKRLNHELNHKNDVIAENLEEKEMLLKEIHHRVKNNLQIVSSLLNFQNAKISDVQLKQIFEESKQKIYAISIIHEKLYKTSNVASINIQDYIADLFDSIVNLSSSNNIKLEVTGPEIKLDLDTMIPLGLILNELITNSLKYAFSNVNYQPKITIHLDKPKENFYKLIYKDNGSGYDTTNIQVKKGFGLYLVKMLSRQLYGEMELHTQPSFELVITFEDMAIRKKREL